MAQLLSTIIQGFLNVEGNVDISGDLIINDTELESLITQLNSLAV